MAVSSSYSAVSTPVIPSISSSVKNLAEHFIGGCHNFRVYAQNRYQPFGTAVRAQPDISAPKNERVVFASNEVIAVDGWIDGSTDVYPKNTPPYDSRIWFHLAYNNGWVTFAGVRAEPTNPGPINGNYSPDGGVPAPTTAVCHGTYTK